LVSKVGTPYAGWRIIGAKKYLDTESLPILAWLLKDYLNQSPGDMRTTVM
jgi:hypothetical protein